MEMSEMMLIMLSIRDCSKKLYGIKWIDAWAREYIQCERWGDA